MAYTPQRRTSDTRASRFFAFFKRFFAVVGVAATIVVVFLSLTLSQAMNFKLPELPEKIILTYHFKPNLADVAGRPSLKQPLLQPPTTLNEVIQALNIAREDDRVRGLVARISNPGYSIAQYQELRDAIIQFRKSGRFAHVYADSYGGFGDGMGSYYLASAFDKIWLQPIGMVSVSGVNSEVPFIRSALKKIGVRAAFDRRGKYKSTPESLIFDQMTDAHREMMQGMVADLSNQMVTGIAEGRQQTVAEIEKLIDKAPFMDKEALEFGLIDFINYSDEMIDQAKETVGEGVELMRLTGYALQVKTAKDEKGMVGFVTNFFYKDTPESELVGKKKIALIFGSGTIMSQPVGSKIGFSTSLGGSVLNVDKIVAAFRTANKDDNVAAIVFRVNSPGGSPTASETLRREIVRAKEKGKIVVISMGNAAASGGYWISTHADKIVAQPGTLTGSIGVFAGKMVLQELWKKIGVNWDQIKTGQTADMWSSNTEMSKASKKRFQAMLDHIYDAFIVRVAEGRNMSAEAVEEIAQGHIWTGKQALEIGLVDALGGLDKALEIAKIEAKLPIDADIPVERFPRRKSTLEMFLQLAMEGGNVSIAEPKILGSLLSEAQAVFEPENVQILKSPNLMYLNY